MPAPEQIPAALQQNSVLPGDGMQGKSGMAVNMLNTLAAYR